MTDNSNTFQLVLSTCAGKKQARAIASALVEARLAACVNIITKAESVYLWEQKVVRDKELLLIIKTRSSQFEQVKQVIEDIHSYELPEIITVPLSAGSAAYLNWLDENIN